MSQDKEPRRRFLRQVLAIVPAATTLGGATTVAVSQPAMASVACTITGGMMFGSTCRTATRHGGLPKARAAST